MYLLKTTTTCSRYSVGLDDILYWDEEHWITLRARADSGNPHLELSCSKCGMVELFPGYVLNQLYLLNKIGEFYLFHHVASGDSARRALYGAIADLMVLVPQAFAEMSAHERLEFIAGRDQ